MLNLYSVGIKDGTQFVLKILFKAVFICGKAGSGKKIKIKINQLQLYYLQSNQFTSLF